MVDRLRSKKIEFASSSKVDDLQAVSSEFMFEIFDLMPGEYLITDESSLRDFTDMCSTDTAPIWRRIEARYAIDLSDASSELLADVFAEIRSRRNLQ